MDNYTMRTVNSMKTPAASDTYGGRLIGAIGNDFRVGIDYEHNTRDAEQNMVISSSLLHLTYLWPGAEISKLGLFLEKDNLIDLKLSYLMG